MKNLNDADVFKERLRFARCLRGLTQVELGQLAKIGDEDISRMEAGMRKPSFKRLAALSDALEVPSDFLVGLMNSQDLFKGVFQGVLMQLTHERRVMIKQLVKVLLNR